MKCLYFVEVYVNAPSLYPRYHGHYLLRTIVVGKETMTGWWMFNGNKVTDGITDLPIDNTYGTIDKIFLFNTKINLLQFFSILFNSFQFFPILSNSFQFLSFQF